MRICLVFPSLRNFGGFNSLGKNTEGIYINHGLASISAVLKQANHEVNLIDLRECSDWGDFAERVRAINADYYGIYCQTLDFWEAKSCAEIIHTNTKAKTIIGGPHPSICPDHALSFDCFDHIFVGEAEKTFPEFIENKDRFGRLIYGEHPVLDALPYEDREAFNIKKILSIKHPIFPSPFISVISGRGCPYNCSFCKPGENRIFGKFRMRSVSHLMGEIEVLAKRYNYKMLMIDDDAFTVDPDYVRQFCDSYKRIRRPFTCQSRVDFIARHPELVKLMREVGLWMFFIGFESGNQRILNLLRKGTTVKQNLDAAEVCHRYGVKIWANVMYGMPTETREEVMDTIGMIRQIKPYMHSPSICTPLYGTALYDLCKEKGLLISDDPVHLGSRNPIEPKIKGQDYEWLLKLINMMNWEIYRRHHPLAMVRRGTRKLLRTLMNVRRD